MQLWREHRQKDFTEIVESCHSLAEFHMVVRPSGITCRNVYNAYFVQVLYPPKAHEIACIGLVGLAPKH